MELVLCLNFVNAFKINKNKIFVTKCSALKLCFEPGKLSGLLKGTSALTTNGRQIVGNSV